MVTYHVEEVATYFLAPVVAACGDQGRAAVMGALVRIVQQWIDHPSVASYDVHRVSGLYKGTPHARRALYVAASALAVINVCSLWDSMAAEMVRLGVDTEPPTSTVAALVWGNVLSRRHCGADGSNVRALGGAGASTPGVASGVAGAGAGAGAGLTKIGLRMVLHGPDAIDDGDDDSDGSDDDSDGSDDDSDGSDGSDGSDDDSHGSDGSDDDSDGSDCSTDSFSTWEEQEEEEDDADVCLATVPDTPDTTAPASDTTASSTPTPAGLLYLMSASAMGLRCLPVSVKEDMANGWEDLLGRKDMMFWDGNCAVEKLVRDTAFLTWTMMSKSPAFATRVHVLLRARPEFPSTVLFAFAFSVFLEKDWAVPLLVQCAEHHGLPKDAARVLRLLEEDLHGPDQQAQLRRLRSSVKATKRARARA